jgi:tRNA nucleotidyltransferase/poly(A) polymerase
LQFKPKNHGYFLKSFRRRMGKSFPLQNCWQDQEEGTKYFQYPACNKNYKKLKKLIQTWKKLQQQWISNSLPSWKLQHQNIDWRWFRNSQG